VTVYERVELRFNMGTLHVLVDGDDLVALIDEATERAAPPVLNVVVRVPAQLCDTPGAS
jgi:hypothetical protein